MKMLTPALVLMMLLALTDGCSHKQQMTTSASENNYGWHVRSYRAPYGEQFTLDCSSHNTTNLIIQHDNKCIQTKKINETTIRATLKPNLGKFLYTCVIGSCENSLEVCVVEDCCGHQLAVDVEPAMAVSAAGVRYTQGTDQYRDYFVSREELYDVFCSSNTPDTLRLRSYWVLGTDVINETTLVYHAYADRTEDRIYQCFDDNQNYQKVTVTTDFPPVAHDFKCVLYHWRRLECSWQSYSERHRFKLFYTVLEKRKLYNSNVDSERVKVDLILCSDESGVRNVSCKWFNRYKGEEVLKADANCSFTLQTCNDIYCNNQTFDISCNAITKLDIINEFKVLNTSTRGVFLSWSVPTARHQFIGYQNFTYNVEYRLKVFGERWRSANTSSASCDHQTCEYLLVLTYPDIEYEVRIFMRFSEAEDSLWSAPASIPSISAEPRDTACACDAPHNPLELTGLSDALCQVCELNEYTFRKSMSLIQLKSNLRRKLDKIERYTRILKDLDSVRS